MLVNYSPVSFIVSIFWYNYNFFDLNAYVFAVAYKSIQSLTKAQ